jgi:hypothetical protein
LAHPACAREASEAADLPDKQKALHLSAAGLSLIAKSTCAKTTILANDFYPIWPVQPFR